MNENQPEVATLKQPELVGANPAVLDSSANAVSEGGDVKVDLLAGLDEKQAKYLKGIGVETLDQESLAKLIDSAISQKASVSRVSKENAEYKAIIASRGELPAKEEPSIPQESEPAQTPAVSTQPETQPTGGVSRNDLFDLSMSINNNFPELIEQATDGSLFNELTQMGYFGIDGIDKQKVHEYLSAKNAQAKELRELREFKAQYDKPQEQESQYNPASAISSGERTPEWARQVITQNITAPGSVSEDILREATVLLQSSF